MYCMWIGVIEEATCGFVIEIFMKDSSSFTRHNRRKEEMEEHRLIHEAIQVMGECQSK